MNVDQLCEPTPRRLMHSDAALIIFTNCTSLLFHLQCKMTFEMRLCLFSRRYKPHTMKIITIYVVRIK